MFVDATGGEEYLSAFTPRKWEFVLVPVQVVFAHAKSAAGFGDLQQLLVAFHWLYGSAQAGNCGELNFFQFTQKAGKLFAWQLPCDVQDELEFLSQTIASCRLDTHRLGL
jgi:hypothetical protein